MFFLMDAKCDREVFCPMWATVKAGVSNDWLIVGITMIQVSEAEQQCRPIGLFHSKKSPHLDHPDNVL